MYIRVRGYTVFSECGGEVIHQITSTRQVSPLRIDLHFDRRVARDDLSSAWNEDLEVFHRRKLITSVRVWSLKNCICVPPNMILLTSDGRIIRESVRKLPLVTKDPRLAEGSEIEIAIAEDGAPAFVVGPGQHWNYCHWMLEIAPKLNIISTLR